MSPTKQRSLFLQAIAAAVLTESHVDITVPMPADVRRRLSHEIAHIAACHYEVAKVQLAKAARRARGELMGGTWGGVREGAGRPPKEEV